MSISSKMWASKAPKNVFLWVSLLCTLLLTGLNLPHSAGAAVAVRIASNDNFVLAHSQAEISPYAKNDVLDFGYKEESEGEESTEEEEEESEQKTAREKKSVGSILLPTPSVYSHVFLCWLRLCQCSTTDTTAVCATRNIPKYILYQQFKYHLG